MGALADTLADLTVSAYSPDGNIRARLRGRNLESVGFRPGAYRAYTLVDLTHQLERLATLIYLGRERGVRQIFDQHGVEHHKDPARARDRAEREWLRRAFDITVIGTGPEELVRFKTTGMMNWQCRIDRAALRLDEGAFVDETRSAAFDLLRRNRREEALLRDECFGLHSPALAAARRRRSERYGPAGSPYLTEAW